MNEPFNRCGYCDSAEHTSAECPVAAEIQEVDDDDEEPVVVDDDEWD